MISYEAIIQQIEKHVVQAKQQASEMALREHLTAIHTLCEVVLQTSQQQVAARPAQMMQVSTTVHTPSTKLEEQDANGESLFDF